MVLVASIIVGVLMAALLYRLFFKDFADFVECLRFYFQPDIISAFRGELVEDWWGSTKLAVWLIVSIGMGAATYFKVGQWLPALKDQRFSPATIVRTVTGRTQSPAAHYEVEDRDVTGSLLTQSTGAVNAATTGLPNADKYRVKVGEIVEISAVTPAIALRRATVIKITDEQLTVRAGVDDYTIRWSDVIRLKSSGRRN
jgi:hypothetical protein